MDNAPHLKTSFARTKAELEAAQRLRYAVFVEELGGDGALVDHEARLERDQFDGFSDHLIVTDTHSGAVVGAYRLMRTEQAAAAGQFYSETEYDLSKLKTSGRVLLELGRSCLHPDYRGGLAMYRLWHALAAYIAEHGVEILFGVASFHGTDSASLAHPLSFLHHHHLAPEELRVKVRQGADQDMDLLAADKIDRRRAVVDMPSLIKAYLRLGGFVGQGAFVDHAFNTTDICLVVDIARMNPSQRRIYEQVR